MCGRLDVEGESLSRWVRKHLRIPFVVETNRDLRPTQTVSTVALANGHLQQLNTTWGIKPAWATSQLINAKAETVTERQTFVKAFAFGRCVVPCSGFYEWIATSNGKVRLRFKRDDGAPLYMAAFHYPGEVPHLVTLTKAAINEHRHIHHRFPVLIPVDDVKGWLSMPPQEAQAAAIQSEVNGIIFEPVREPV